jgi:flagellar P-ring protein precursor FlgI
LLSRVPRFLVGFLAPSSAKAERIKDIAMVEGARSNQLVGFGLVVGLDGTGDQVTQTPFTIQAARSMLQQFGVNLPQGVNPQTKNMASVIVTAELPAFGKPGQKLDVTVSSLGNAGSLRGGELLLTSLKGGNGQVYAVAQGHSWSQASVQKAATARVYRSILSLQAEFQMALLSSAR